MSKLPEEPHNEKLKLGERETATLKNKDIVITMVWRRKEEMLVVARSGRRGKKSTSANWVGPHAFIL